MNTGKEIVNKQLNHLNIWQGWLEPLQQVVVQQEMQLRHNALLFLLFTLEINCCWVFITLPT